MKPIYKDKYGYWVREDWLAGLQIIPRIVFPVVAFKIYWLMGILALSLNLFLLFDHLKMLKIFWKHSQWTSVGKTGWHLIFEIVFPAIKWDLRV